MGNVKDYLDQKPYWEPLLDRWIVWEGIDKITFFTKEQAEGYLKEQQEKYNRWQEEMDQVDE